MAQTDDSRRSWSGDRLAAATVRAAEDAANYFTTYAQTAAR